MKENLMYAKTELLELAKEIVIKTGKIAILIAKTGADACGKLANKGAELVEKGVQSDPVQKVRPAVRIVMCVSCAVALLSGLLVFLTRKKK